MVQAVFTNLSYDGGQSVQFFLKGLRIWYRVLQPHCCSACEARSTRKPYDCAIGGILLSRLSMESLSTDVSQVWSNWIGLDFKDCELVLPVWEEKKTVALLLDSRGL